MPIVWKLAAGQLTLFSSPGSPPGFSALDVYKAIWGDQPDSFQRQPAPLGPTFANGRRGNAVVGCTVQPLRVDIALNPVQVGLIEPGDSLPMFEGASEILDEFENVLNAIGAAKIEGSYNRIALQVQYRAQASSPAEANDILAASLPDRYRLHLKDEENVLLQINSPYENERVGSLRVNRVTRWSVDTVQVLTIAVPIGATQVSPGASGAPEVPRLTPFITATVSFEENNAPSPVPLSCDQLVQLGREGIKHAMESGRALGFEI